MSVQATTSGSAPYEGHHSVSSASPTAAAAVAQRVPLLTSSDWPAFESNPPFSSPKADAARARSMIILTFHRYTNEGFALAKFKHLHPVEAQYFEALHEKMCRELLAFEKAEKTENEHQAFYSKFLYYHDIVHRADNEGYTRNEPATETIEKVRRFYNQIGEFGEKKIEEQKFDEALQAFAKEFPLRDLRNKKIIELKPVDEGKEPNQSSIRATMGKLATVACWVFIVALSVASGIGMTALIVKFTSWAFFHTTLPCAVGVATAVGIGSLGAGALRRFTHS